MVILKKFKKLKRYETFQPYSEYINVRWEDREKYLTENAYGWTAKYELFGRVWKGDLSKTHVEGYTKRFRREPDYLCIELIWASASNRAFVNVSPRWRELDCDCVRLAYFDNTI